jgi:hypothetical protein
MTGREALEALEAELAGNEPLTRESLVGAIRSVLRRADEESERTIMDAIDDRKAREEHDSREAGRPAWSTPRRFRRNRQ